MGRTNFRDVVNLVDLLFVSAMIFETRLKYRVHLAPRAKENENYMKKDREPGKDELRAEYKRSDFPEGLVRGKYAKRLRESSNIVVLRPEVAQAFPNGDAVNNALLSLIEIAQKTTRLAGRSTRSPKKRASR